ncbi:hypothetical protein AMATHDRAFT_77265 [Amanita thiersii Skay4041]|uniref:ADP-ribosylhydrolase ARH3 n=1 Tax=Amanita thiersii Skay4041 TaxID=703135 RepID=A0A2A9N9M4_9AGAR|nr:hypothetical protein AMATHDRAFT_77265 [Amanita thiersii Skay4041]
MSSQTRYPRPLHEQRPTPASAATKIRIAILATAIVDALGGPGEFKPRFRYPFIDSMIPNEHFDVPPGTWTDDTSMMLCLAHSIATSTSPDGFHDPHQMDMYLKWYKEGYLSPTGDCFDIGNSTRYALDIYSKRQMQAQTPPKDRRFKSLFKSFTKATSSPQDYYTFSWSTLALAEIRKTLEGDVFSGNGSLMRLLPIPLVYYYNTSKTREYARRSSETTHPSRMCIELCEVWAHVIAMVMRATTGSSPYYDITGKQEEKKITKLDILHYIATHQWRHRKLEQAFKLPNSHPTPPHPPDDSPITNPEELESFYQEHHPIFKVLAEVRQGNPSERKIMTDLQPEGPPEEHARVFNLIPETTKIPSQGFVANTFAAALYCFLATETFEDGALLAVNLGHDTDTTGAVYAGLAGTWYGCEDDPDEEKTKDVGRDKSTDEREGEVGMLGSFWSERVRTWGDELVKREMVEEVAEELVQQQQM